MLFEAMPVVKLFHAELALKHCFLAAFPPAMPTELGAGLVPVATVGAEVWELVSAAFFITRVLSRDMIVERASPSERSRAQFALILFIGRM